MNPQAIKTWEIKHEKESQFIRLYEDRLELSSTYSNKVSSFTLIEFFTQNIKPPFTKFEAEICAQIQQHCPSPINLNKTEQKHWDFWKCFDHGKIPSCSFDGLTFWDSTDFLECSPLQLRKGSRKKNGSIVYRENYRWNDLFFKGPKVAALALEDRKHLRKIVLNALGNEALFSTKDAFPLFDYSKIEAKKWAIVHNQFESDYVHLRSKDFCIGQTSHPAHSLDFGGHCYYYSIEEIWSNRPNFVDKKFKANQAIKSILEQAIIP